MMERKQSFSLKYLLMILILFVTLSAAAGTLAGSLQASAASISKKNVRIVKGQTTKLRIKGASGKVKWKSNRKAVAVVSSTGRITAKRKGTAVITATVGKKKYTCKVKVFNKLTKKQAEKAVAAYCEEQGVQFWYATEKGKNGKYNVWVHYGTGAQGKYVVNTKTGKVNIYEPYGFSSITPEFTDSFSALKYL